jgi:phage/plasmid-associated DNA primase
VGLGATPHLFALLNKRCIGYSEGETSDTFELNESVCKQISGQDDISCRGLFKDQITFKSIGKLNFLTNHIPRLSGEKSVKDRLRILSFKQEFQDNPKKGQRKRDPEFIEKLETIYLDEVFSWMVKGSKEYYKDHTIKMPQSFEDETERFLLKEDSISSFFKNRMTVTNDNKDIIKRKDLFEKYQEYCNGNSQRCQPRSSLFQRLEHMKIQTTTLHGYDVFRGIKIFAGVENKKENKKEVDEYYLQIEDENMKLKKIIEQMTKVAEMQDIINKSRGNRLKVMKLFENTQTVTQIKKKKLKVFESDSEEEPYIESDEEKEVEIVNKKDVDDATESFFNSFP